MTEEFNLSDRIFKKNSFAKQYNGNMIVEEDVKEFIRLLKDKDFIMSILAEDVTIDTEEEMKFIDVEGVRTKIDKLAGEKLSK